MIPSLPAAAMVKLVGDLSMALIAPPRSIENSPGGISNPLCNFCDKFRGKLRKKDFYWLYFLPPRKEDIRPLSKSGFCNI